MLGSSAEVSLSSERVVTRRDCTTVYVTHNIKKKGFVTLTNRRRIENPFYRAKRLQAVINSKLNTNKGRFSFGIHRFF